MNSIEKIYLEILNENKNYYGYEINDKVFQPFEYRKVYCCASILNKDIDHLIKRITSRTGNTLDEIFIVLKRGINKFLELANTKYKDRRKKSFHIISKEYNKFKLAIEITVNFQKDPFITLENSTEFFYDCDYICFLYTVLEPNMIKHPMDDKLFVEENKNNNQINILYVD